VSRDNRPLLVGNDTAGPAKLLEAVGQRLDLLFGVGADVAAALPQAVGRPLFNFVGQDWRAPSVLERFTYYDLRACEFSQIQLWRNQGR
jgi:hypothetical protein